MTDKKGDFILRIPLPDLQSLDDMAEVAVYVSIYSHLDNGKGECWASQRAIANRAHCSQDTVARRIPTLIAKGLIRAMGTRTVPGGETNVYRLGERQSFTKSSEVNENHLSSERYSGTKQLNETDTYTKENINSMTDSEIKSLLPHLGNRLGSMPVLREAKRRSLI